MNAPLQAPVRRPLHLPPLPALSDPEPDTLWADLAAWAALADRKLGRVAAA